MLSRSLEVCRPNVYLLVLAILEEFKVKIEPKANGRLPCCRNAQSHMLRRSADPRPLILYLPWRGLTPPLTY